MTKAERDRLLALEVAVEDLYRVLRMQCTVNDYTGQRLDLLERTLRLMSGGVDYEAPPEILH